MSALVSLDEVPSAPIGADAAGEAARRVRERWKAVARCAVEYGEGWRHLDEVYATAQTPALVDRSTVVSATGVRSGWAASDVARALDAFATDMATAGLEASELAEDIVAFRRRVVDYRASAHEPHSDPDWGWGQYDENSRLRNRAQTLKSDISAAVNHCVRALEGIEPAPRTLRHFVPAQTPLMFRASAGAAHAQFETRMFYGILGALENAADPSAMLALLDERPEWLDYLWAHPPHHETVATWWAELDPAAATALIAGASLIVGNLNGLPFRDRIAANRQTLAREVDRLRALPADQRDAELLASYERMLNDEHQYRDQSGRWVPTTGSQLLVFDPAHSAVATYHGPLDPVTGGIPDWVDNVAVSVPGTGSSLAGFADERAAALYQEAHARPGNDSAIIQWCGGEMPASIPAATQDDYARDLAPRLSSFVDAMPAPAAADVTVLGHSYGGATVGLASTLGLHADRVLFVSSAGMGNAVTGVEDYRFRSTTDYYSMMVRNDAVVGAVQGLTWMHGETPLSAPGVTRLETGQIDAADPSSADLEDYQAPGASRPSAIQAHSTVYTPGSTAFANMVGVITGGRAQAFMPDTTEVLGTGVVYTIDGNDREDLDPVYLEID